MFGHRTIESEPADREGDHVSQDDPEHSADESDGQGFGQKLQEDVAAARAERFFDANFAGALRTETSMMFMRPTPPMPRVRVPMNPSRTFRPRVTISKRWTCSIRLNISTARRSRGLNLCCSRENIPNRLFDPLVVGGLVVEPDAVKIVGVFQIAHGGERNIDDPIHVVVALLHFGRKNADHFEADAIEADALA